MVAFQIKVVVGGFHTMKGKFVPTLKWKIKAVLFAETWEQTFTARRKNHQKRPSFARGIPC
jgi:hypothetical protein